MADLYLSLSIMILLCGLAALVGARIAFQALPATQLKGQLLASGLMLVYLCCLWDRPVLTRWMPWSSVIVLGNWLPLIACFLTGMYCRTPAVAVSRRCVLAMAGFLLSGYSLVCPVLGSPPECFFYSRGQIFQIQTREDTCSAASAACLLRLHGIRSSEGEMARLCLTRAGTHWMGVYRGLKLKTAGTAWDVVAEEFDPRETPVVNHFHPGVLSMAFASRSGAQILASGLSMNSGHSVVLLEREADGHIQVFDPSPEFGFERWGKGFQSDIRSAVLLRLVPRDSRAWSREQLRQRIPAQNEQNNAGTDQGLHGRRRYSAPEHTDSASKNHRCLRHEPAAAVMTLIYKICTQSEWNTAVRLGRYTGSVHDHRDGFIHFSDASQVTATFRRHFADQQNLLIFCVDDNDLGDSIRWEPSRGGALFPHLYAEIPLQVIRQSAPLKTDNDGNVQLPES